MPSAPAPIALVDRVASQRGIEALLESSSDWAWATDPGGRFVWVTQGVAKSVGIRPDELIGRSRLDVAADALDREKLLELAATMRAHEPFEHFVYRLRRADGVERTLEVGGVPMFGADGAFEGYVGLGKDVTEREQAEQRVQIAQRRMTDAIESLSEGFALFDPGGRFVLSNRAFAGLTQAAGARAGFGVRIGDLTAKLGPAAVAARAACWAADGSRGADFEGAASGRVYKVAERRTREGGIVAIWTDVTEERRLAAERAQLEIDLRQSQKLDSLGTLAGGIAHEINTPAQYVGDNIQFLKSAFTDMMRAIESLLRGRRPEDLEFLLAEVPGAIDQALEGVTRIREIVAAVKAFSYPDAAEKSPADLHAAINTTLTVSRNQWKYVADIETDFDAAMPPVPCHIGEINQVVLNLVVNAAHAIEAKGGGRGLITVTTRKRGDCAEIRVHDTGTGVAPEIAERIFDPFFTTKPQGKGSGQGLAISRSIVVKNHRGTLQLKSAPGEGSEFTVRLPLDPSKTIQTEIAA